MFIRPSCRPAHWRSSSTRWPAGPRHARSIANCARRSPLVGSRRAIGCLRLVSWPRSWVCRGTRSPPCTTSSSPRATSAADAVAERSSIRPIRVGRPCARRPMPPRRPLRRGSDPFDVPPRFDLRPGSPDPALFPTAVWRRCMAAALLRAPPRLRRSGRPAGVAGDDRSLDQQVSGSRTGGRTRSSSRPALNRPSISPFACW